MENISIQENNTLVTGYPYYVAHENITATVDADDYIFSGDGIVTIEGGNDNDAVTNLDDYYDLGLSGDEVDNVLVKTNNSYIYTGGDKYIDNYEMGEQIQFAADITDVDFMGRKNLVVNSSAGSLTVENFKDKVLDFTDSNGNTFAYVYGATEGGTIDGSAFSTFEVIAGAHVLVPGFVSGREDNVIIAGNGGSWLWGGKGNISYTDRTIVSYKSATLIGGSGEDTFFVGKDDCCYLTIREASANDIINLYDASLSDIVSLDATENSISFKTSQYTVSRLRAYSTENLSPIFQLAEGRFQYNHSSGEWQVA